MQGAALISQMDPPPGERGDFDDWYTHEHVPARMAIRGFTGAVRAWAVQGSPSHLAVYYLKDLRVLATPEYRALKEQPSDRTARILDTVTAFTRYTAEQIGDTGATPPGRYLYLVTFAVPEARLEAFDEWYEQDHLPLLLRSSHWLRCRRYAIAEGDPPSVTRAAVHELGNLRALSSPERAEARETDWRRRLAAEPWFSSARYAVYERAQDFAPSARSHPDGRDA